jgi:hypothetical protein
MTHRDPAEVVGSACSLLKEVRLMYSDDVDLPSIGENLLETFDVMLERSEAFRRRHGRDAILDVHYADVMRDPIGSVAAIYRRFGEPFTREAEAAMEAYLAANPKGKHGRHAYSLEDYGLTARSVRARFADYIERYDIPVKG